MPAGKRRADRVRHLVAARVFPDRPHPRRSGKAPWVSAQVAGPSRAALNAIRRVAPIQPGSRGERDSRTLTRSTCGAEQGCGHGRQRSMVDACDRTSFKCSSMKADLRRVETETSCDLPPTEQRAAAQRAAPRVRRWFAVTMLAVALGVGGLSGCASPSSAPSGPHIPYGGNGGGPTQCADGSVSGSSGPGTCSHHGGEAG